MDVSKVTPETVACHVAFKTTSSPNNYWGVPPGFKASHQNHPSTAPSSVANAAPKVRTQPVSRHPSAACQQLHVARSYLTWSLVPQKAEKRTSKGLQSKGQRGTRTFASFRQLQPKRICGQHSASVCHDLASLCENPCHGHKGPRILSKTPF